MIDLSKYRVVPIDGTPKQLNLMETIEGIDAAYRHTVLESPPEIDDAAKAVIEAVRDYRQTLAMDDAGYPSDPLSARTKLFASLARLDKLENGE